MRKPIGLLAVVGIVLLTGTSFSQTPKKETRIDLQHSDILEVVTAPTQDTTFVIGNVIFQTQTGTIYCDSAVWLKGKRVKLKGRVVVNDSAYRIAADSVDYDLGSGEANALGSYVELWSRPDSLFAVGTQAFYDRDHKYFYMENRPTMYLRYPDTVAMIEVIANLIQYDGLTRVAQASGDVRISSKEINATSGCAVMHPADNSIDLFEEPVAKRGKSTVSGKLISVTTENRLLSKIDVYDSARGEFNEPVDAAKKQFDQSILTGKHIEFDFSHGLLQSVVSTGQAYSWYFPSNRGRSERNENTVSGDSILFSVLDEKLQVVTVKGGAIGSFLDSKTTIKDTLNRSKPDSSRAAKPDTSAQVKADTVPKPKADTAQQLKTALAGTKADTLHAAKPDTLFQTKTDTIDYSSQVITYDLRDSTIMLHEHSHVTSGTMTLDAQKILLDTRTNIVKAYSAAIPKPDTTHRDTTMTAKLQPNTIPVILKDKDQELYGDYLEYSLTTQKGRIVQSKSKYEAGTYYGEKIFRATKSILYVDDGRYTTCDADEPHFHFYSSHMKLMENDKLIARPVVFFIGRLPILALPYYVFPLKKGRHSGILPFRFGNFERGERYVENVGYYWAASQYWDWQNSIAYFERSSTLTYQSLVNYNKLYSFNGNFSIQATRQTQYSSDVGQEQTGTRYVITANHSQQVTPSFNISGSGQYQSDPSYFTDLSTNLNDRLNRAVRSTFQFRKAFSRTISLSGAMTHEEFLDLGSRTDVLPSLALALPPLKPFGSGKLDDEGRAQPRWFNNLYLSYSPRFVNSYSRATLHPKTTDTSIVGTDTTITQIPAANQLGVYTWRQYYRFDHSLSASFPLTIAQYFTFSPSANYSESWFRIAPTDQSEAAGINTSSGYRTYAASTGASLLTHIYGTITPNILGLTGFRQVLTPSIGYSYVPKTALHVTEASFAGAVVGSAAPTSNMNISLAQLYQAKFKHGDGERALDLLSINSSASYNFKADSLKWSDVSTSFQSNVLPRINVNGSFTHSLYRPGTSELRFFSPYLMSFNFSTSFQISGSRFLFDDAAKVLRKGVDSASQLTPAPRLGEPSGAGVGGSSSQWSMSVAYTYSESGRDASYFKTSFLRWNIGFNVTPTTTVAYSQSFDPVRGVSSYNSVSITKILHCWTGYLTWVPTGSTRGWAFQLFVTALPAIKIDNSQSVVSSSILGGNGGY